MATTNSLPVAAPSRDVMPQFSTQRRMRLKNDLKDALKSMPQDELNKWGAVTAEEFGKVLVRRGKRLLDVTTSIGTSIFREIGNAIKATANGRLSEHAKDRSNAATNSLRAFHDKLRSTVPAIKAAFSSEPADMAMLLLAGTIGFYAGSGGPDGDGGIPDLDLLGGIGAHRSIFTHSIIAGAAVETAVFALVDLTRRLHKYLPKEHDTFWDKLIEIGAKSADVFVIAASAGIATHLAIDNTIDGFTPYKDMPVSAPLGVHEAILAGNAVTEGIDATARAQKVGAQFRTYPTWKEAKEAAQKQPRSKIVRSADGQGYTVHTPMPEKKS